MGVSRSVLRPPDCDGASDGVDGRVELGVPIISRERTGPEKKDDDSGAKAIVSVYI